MTNLPLPKQPCCSSRRASVLGCGNSPGSFQRGQSVRSSHVLQGRVPLKSCESHHRKLGCDLPVSLSYWPESDADGARPYWAITSSSSTSSSTRRRDGINQ